MSKFYNQGITTSEVTEKGKINLEELKKLSTNKQKIELISLE